MPSETGHASRARELSLLAVFTLLLHVPFLWQPVQGDEVNYLDMAREVFRQPLTPENFHFVFQGHVVNMAGHPHPPMNAYLLALAWLLAGRFSELFFHLFYLIFALGISFAAYALAARFTPRPLWAALMVAAAPLVQVNTNTLAGTESPGLAFLLAGAAAFFWRRLWMSGIALSLAGLTELQALALPPILLLDYALKHERPPRAAWLALAAPYVALAAWQVLQWRLTGVLPGAALLAYASGSSYGRFGLRASSALALFLHMGVLVLLVPMARRRMWGVAPGLLAAALVRGYPWWERGLLVLFMTLSVNALVWLWEGRRRQPLLADWALGYFAFAAAVFFAGASRYLLPLVAPMVMLFVLQFADRPQRLKLALVISLVLGLNLSFAAYEFSRVYKKVPPPPGPAFLVNGEWGFRYYMLEHGGRMLETSSVPRPGEWIVSSELSLAGNYDSLAEETAVPVRAIDLTVRTPLRLIDRYAHSGFSAVSAGLLPFSFSSRPLDRIRYARTSQFLDVPGDWKPTQFSGRLVYLPAPGAAIRIPIDRAAARLHFALFARGRGRATFRIQDSAGATLFEETRQAEGDLWQARTVPVDGLREVIMTVDTPPELRAGWGELVAEGGFGPGPPPDRPYLDTGDLRCRPQLVSGWYGIEDGAWRWMAPRAEAVLRTPAGATNFDLQLFFPPHHMERAGGSITLSVLINDKLLGQETYSEPGGYRFTKPVPTDWLTLPTSRIRIRLSRWLAPAGSEQRELGAVVQGLGFVEAR